MDNKKTFFASVGPKASLGIGVLTGFMVLCTVGFIVLGALMLNGSKSKAETNTNINTNTNTIPTTANNNVVTNVIKAKKPTAELFVMSYCPFGLQVQKAILPVMDLLSKQADIKIKFVNYIMHQKQEGDENTLQYCVQKEQSDKLVAYLKCFTASGDSASCLSSTKVDEKKLKTCVDATNKEFDVLAQYSKGATYPSYLVHNDLNNKYGVQGSPTLVVNGAKVENVARNPESIKQIICSAFEKQPKECEQTLSSVTAGTGFGTQAGTASASADCGN